MSARLDRAEAAAQALVREYLAGRALREELLPRLSRGCHKEGHDWVFTIQLDDEQADGAQGLVEDLIQPRPALVASIRVNEQTGRPSLDDWIIPLWEVAPGEEHDVRAASIRAAHVQGAAAVGLDEPDGWRAARSLRPGDPPEPWGERIVIAASGALAVGWDTRENVVLISSDGYSVTAPRTGERLVRDRDHERTSAALSEHNLTFTVPRTGQTLSVLGLVSGDGIHVTRDGWELRLIAPHWPRQVPVLVRPAREGMPKGFRARAHALALWRLAEWDWLRCGFSPSGTHFLIFGPEGAEVFSREGRSPTDVPAADVQEE